jgi:hypothetical protein
MDRDDIEVGMRVRKTGGDYTYEGVVVSKFFKLSGACRLVVEDDRGLLFIFNAGQLERVTNR